MTNHDTASPGVQTTQDQIPSTQPAMRGLWHRIRNRLFEGLLVILPLLITFWIVHWIYSTLDKNVIEPLAKVVIWKAQNLNNLPELPYWFETYVAPLIALVLALLILYGCGVMAHTQLRK